MPALHAGESRGPYAVRKYCLAPTVPRNRLTFLSNVVAYACRHLAQEDRYSAHASDVCFEIGAGSPPKAWGILLPF
jgi:hypothetical protein